MGHGLKVFKTLPGDGTSDYGSWVAYCRNDPGCLVPDWAFIGGRKAGHADICTRKDSLLTTFPSIDIKNGTGALAVFRGKATTHELKRIDHVAVEERNRTGLLNVIGSVERAA